MIRYRLVSIDWVKWLLIFFSLLFLSLSLTSCSTISKAMLPYKENFECQRSVDYGYCGPVSKVYQESVIISRHGGVQW